MIASMQSSGFEIEQKSHPAQGWNTTGGLLAILAACVFLLSSTAVHALTPLRNPKDTVLLKEAQAACAAPNFPRFLKAFASSHIVRNAYTAGEVQFAVTRIDAERRRQTTTRLVPRLGFRDFPLRFEEDIYVLAPVPPADRPSSRFNEARLQFLSPRRITGQTAVRWSVDRGRMASEGHERAAHYGYRGDFVFVGDGTCWKLTRVRAILQP
jgi:hypothetical protein